MGIPDLPFGLRKWRDWWNDNAKKAIQSQRPLAGAGMDAQEGPNGIMLSRILELPPTPGGGNYVLTLQDGVLVWEAIEDC